MENLNSTTEQRILLAAEQVFLEKGMDGARMQDIADRAGINKALLHYYFRSKEKLFDAIFEANFKQFIPVLDKVIQENMDLKTALKRLANLYYELLTAKPYLPIFILTEINRNPGQIENNLINKMGIRGVITRIIEKMKNEQTIQADPRQVVISTISAIIFPFVARQLLIPLVFENDPENFQQFMDERREFLPLMIDSLFQQFVKPS